jgi:hypothetical protein
MSRGTWNLDRILSVYMVTLTSLFLMLFAFQNCAQPLPDLSIYNQAAADSSPANGSSAQDAGISCKQILAGNFSQGSGTYWINPDGTKAFQVYCDMVTGGGGWTLIARNPATTTFTNFNQSWAEYKAGFGDLTDRSNFGWLGNDAIHALSAAGVELNVVDDLALHNYTSFKVGGEDSKYYMTVAASANSNDGGFFVSSHSGLPFSTYDSDNDTWPNNCASYFSTGWWFSTCYSMTLAGNDSGQVYWRDSAGNEEHVQWIEMWVR